MVNSSFIYIVNFVTNIFKLLYYKAMIPLLRLYDHYRPFYKVEKVVHNEKKYDEFHEWLP